MNINAAILDLEQRNPGATRGDTARPGHSYYDSASRLDFHFCQCLQNDTMEYVAEGPNGGAHHVSINSETLVITCGPKGYHGANRPVCSA